MSKVESISRYILIIKKLRKQHSATFEEIADMLSSASELQGLNLNISKRTFDRDRNDILTIFNIDIKYDFSQKVYCIDNEDEMKSEAIERIFEDLDILNALNVVNNLADFIHLEKRKPQGTENLHGLLHAIKKKLQIKFSYQKFYRDTISERTVEPYALKEFKNRWYLLAKDVWDKNVKTYALDRFTNLDITKTKFTLPNDFDIVERFRYCFGIISANNNQKPQEVILSFDALQGNYIKTMPLHETQEILVDTKDELQIKLKVYITHDFIMELLSYGKNVKVLQPKRLINEMKAVYKKALEYYS